jgi:hypothetical protein
MNGGQADFDEIRRALPAEKMGGIPAREPVFLIALTGKYLYSSHREGTQHLLFRDGS